MSDSDKKQSFEYVVGDILIFNSKCGEYKNVPVRVYRLQTNPKAPYHIRDLNYMSMKVDDNNLEYGASSEELHRNKLDRVLK